MAQAEVIPTTSRRRFLAVLGLAGASATVTAVAVTAKVQEESTGHFTQPAEYVAAMHSIGWSVVAMFHRRDDGSIHRMGVNETWPTEEKMHATWDKFHAISMRMPVQICADTPQKGWWEQVWHYLYDHGFREDVTPTRKNKSEI